MTIETDRLILRPLTMDDAADMYEYAKDPDVGPNAGWKPHTSIEDTRETLKTVFLGHDGIFGMILAGSGKLIGTVGVLNDPKRENDKVKMLGYAIGKKYWGNGYTTEASRAVLDYAFCSLGLELVSVYCYPYNVRSKRIIDKLGFHHEGTLAMCERRFDGIVFDNDCYALTAEEWKSNS